jgi:MFS transporter, DHA2 family, multidrug resistance protein
MSTVLTDPSSDKHPRAGTREWIGLAVLALPLLLVSMDISVLYFAVPFISSDLEATAAEQLWIFDIYGFVLAGLLITMGSLGDRIGRRRLLMIGALLFGLASLAAAYAHSPSALIAARALLGIGGATLMPSTLALIRNMFHDPEQRSKAIAVWSMVLMGGIALGPVLSGVLLEHFWWGSVFLINAPFMLMLLVLAPMLLPEFRSKTRAPVDLFGSLLSLGAILPFIYGIKHWATGGADLTVLVSICAGLLLGVAFVLRQRRQEHPMIDLSLFSSYRFSGGMVTNLIATFAMIGNTIFLTQYLQMVQDLSPLRAALWSLLPSMAIAGAAPTAQAFGRKYQQAYVVSGGFLVASSGFVVLTQAEPDSWLGLVLIGAGLLSMGLVAVITLATELVVGTAQAERAGSASALVETGSELGGALGIALLGSVGAAAYRSGMDGRVPGDVPEELRSEASEGIAGATAVAGHLPLHTAQELMVAAKDAFTHSLNVVAWSGLGLLVLSAVLTASVLGGGRAEPPAVKEDAVLPGAG